MNRIPIGYQVKIRRKWPRVVFSILFIFVVGLLFLLIKPDFSKLKNLFTSIDNNAEKVQESEKITDNIKGNNISEKLKLVNYKEQEGETAVLFEPVTEVDIIKENKEDVIIKPGISKNEEPAISSKTVVVEGNEKLTLETTEPVTNDFTVNDSSLLLTKSESVIESRKDTIETVKYVYYVIVGSVKTREEAKNQQKKYLSMSENTDIIFESSINRYRISLGTYSGFKQASVKSKAFQAKHPNYKTWIWKSIPVTEE